MMFFDILQQKCKEEGIKLTPLLKNIGLSTGNISKWRNGSIPNGDVLNKLAKALNCSVDFLLGNEHVQNKNDFFENYKEQLANALKKRSDADLLVDKDGNITDLGLNLILKAIPKYEEGKEI